MELAALVKAYLERSGGFGRSLHLSELGLPKAEVERVLSALDEDYQISRYLLLSREPDENLTSFPVDARVFVVNGYECSHLSLLPDIQKLL